MQERIYIKLTTTERAPYPYRLEETDDISLVGYARYIDAKICQTLLMFLTF